MTTETTTAETASTESSAPLGKQTFIWGVGRRKSATARVRVAIGSGKITINKRELNDFLSGERDRKSIFGPIDATSTGGKIDIHARCDGGGPSGQAGALRLAIARALNEIDRENNRPALKKAGFLTRDARVIERKKAGLKKARKASQFSKR